MKPLNVLAAKILCNLPEQSSFFYQSNWTPDVDALLLRTILLMQKTLNWKGIMIPKYFWLEAQANIEVEFGFRFTWDQLYERLQSLGYWYQTLRRVAVVHGKFWDVYANIITASEKVWKNIFKVYILFKKKPHIFLI